MYARNLASITKSLKSSGKFTATLTEIRQMTGLDDTDSQRLVNYYNQRDLNLVGTVTCDDTLKTLALLDQGSSRCLIDHTGQSGQLYCFSTALDYYAERLKSTLNRPPINHNELNGYIALEKSDVARLCETAGSLSNLAQLLSRLYSRRCVSLVYSSSDMAVVRVSSEDVKNEKGVIEFLRCRKLYRILKKEEEDVRLALDIRKSFHPAPSSLMWPASAVSDKLQSMAHCSEVKELEEKLSQVQKAVSVAEQSMNAAQAALP